MGGRQSHRIDEGPHGAAYETAREIARTEGLLCGITSGANVCVARRVAATLPADAVVVTVLVDSGLKYLAGDLFA